jgi:hypothetical protein
MRRRGSAGGLAIAITLIAGCGSDKPLSQAEFVATANTSCHSAERALDRQRAPKTPAQFEREVNRSGFVVQQLYDKLASLKPPKSDAGLYERFLKLLDGDIRAAHAVERAVLNQRYTRLAGLQNGRVSAAKQEASYARALGISSCAGVTILELPKPPKPKPQPASAGGSAVPGIAGPGFEDRPLRSSDREDFIAGCSARVPRAACECLYTQLTERYGANTTGKLLSLADKTRGALVNGSPENLPRELKGATIACRSQLGLGA